MTDLWNVYWAHSWLITGIALSGALIHGFVKGKREAATKWDTWEAGYGEFPSKDLTEGSLTTTADRLPPDDDVRPLSGHGLVGDRRWPSNRKPAVSSGFQ